MSFTVGDDVRVEGDPAVIWAGPVVGRVVAIKSAHSEPWYDVEAEGRTQVTLARYMTKIEEDNAVTKKTHFEVGDRVRIVRTFFKDIGFPDLAEAMTGATSTVTKATDPWGNTCVRLDVPVSGWGHQVRVPEVEPLIEEEPATEPSLAQKVADLEAEVTRLRAENERLTGVVDEQDEVIQRKNSEAVEVRRAMTRAVDDLSVALRSQTIPF